MWPRCVLALSLTAASCGRLGFRAPADGGPGTSPDDAHDGPSVLVDGDELDGTTSDAKNGDGGATFTCPSNYTCGTFVTTGHHFGHQTSGATDWGGAAASCPQDMASGHLATITSQAENDFVSLLTGAVPVWIGGSDAAVEGTWTWVTGEPMTYTNWKPSQPSGAMGENYMILHGEVNGGTWTDDLGSSAYGFVCEVD